MILILILILISSNTCCKQQKQYAEMAIRIGWCVLVCCMIWAKCFAYLANRNGLLLVIHFLLVVLIPIKLFILNSLKTILIILMNVSTQNMACINLIAVCAM